MQVATIERLFVFGLRSQVLVVRGENLMHIVTRSIQREPNMSFVSEYDKSAEDVMLPLASTEEACVC